LLLSCKLGVSGISSHYSSAKRKVDTVMVIGSNPAIKRTETRASAGRVR